MNKKRILTTALAVVFFSLISASAFAYYIDGSLSDWGVTPFTSWNPANANIDRTVLDDSRPVSGGGGGSWGGEHYDVEAIYFDNDANNLYFAMVSSYPLNGSLSGDLALDLDGNPGYEYDLNIRGLGTSSSTQNVNLFKNVQWVECMHTFANPIFMESGTGTLAGSALVSYIDAGLIEDNAKGNNCWDLLGDYGDTYILEGRISRSLFTTSLTNGSIVNLHWSEYCGNDFIDLRADIDQKCPPPPSVPEPASMSLLSIGLFGLLGLKKKKA